MKGSGNMKYTELNKEQLKALHKELESEYAELKAKNLKLDMSRGKPCPDQLDLSMDALTILRTEADLKSENGFDCRNYGILEGVTEARELIAAITDAEPEEVFIGGNSSLNLMYMMIAQAWIHGINGQTPWGKLPTVKFLCPVPGYDRHFKITESFGIEMINIPMSENGPDIEMIENYVNNDSAVKGIWCIPKYSNPDGYTYSAETVRRMANLKPAATDFRIFWDNAYIIHHFDFDHADCLLNLRRECAKAGNPEMVYEFMSTSKVLFPGAGIAALITTEKNIKETLNHTTVQTIGHDKINQLRHVKFFKNLKGVEEHMKKHAAIIIPRFEIVFENFKELGELGIARWTKPNGGYFISLFTIPGCAKRTVALCKEAGVVLTGAGAAYPYGIDPNDEHIRIAPTYPSMEDLAEACKAMVVCAKLAAVEKLMA